MFVSRENGFRLLEPMILIAIISVIASFAVPTYTDFNLEARVLNVKQAVAQCKSEIIQRFETGKTMTRHAVNVAIRSQALCKQLSALPSMIIRHDNFYRKTYNLFIEFDASWPKKIAGRKINLRFDGQSPESGFNCHWYGDTLRHYDLQLKNTLCH